MRKLTMVVVAYLLGLAAGVFAQSTQPNMIIIFMDDMGYNDIGAQTYPEQDPYPASGPAPMPNHSDPDIPAPNEAANLTPAIDSLAADGLCMTQYYTVSICSPARGSLMSGRFNQRLNIPRVFVPNGNQSGGLSTREVTLPELLRQEGYATRMVGKWHLGYEPGQADPMQFMPTRHGFQSFYGFPHSNDMNDYNLIENESVLEFVGESEAGQNDITWQLTEKALSFINDSTAENKPFFLYFAHPMTHTPCWPSNQEYTNADGTTWPIFKGASGVSYYYDVVMEVNHSVDRILTRLEDLGIENDTIVIFTSDNGPWLKKNNIDLTSISVGCAYPLKDGKATTWEGGIRVPFLVRWPGVIPTNSTSDQVGAVIDIMPTLAQIGGATLPTDRTIDGIDLLPAWKGIGSSPNRTYYTDERGSDKTLIKGHWKLRNSSLYDLDTDIQESTDLSGDPTISVIYAELQAERTALINSFATDNEPRGAFTDFEILLSGNDIEVPEGGTATMGLRLSADPGQSVTASVSWFSGDTNLSVAAGASLAFNSANWSAWQTVAFAAAVDADDTSNGATFRASLSTDDNVREIFVMENDNADTSPTNLVPVVDAGADLEIALPDAVSLLGSVRDDGPCTLNWARDSGPGSVVFADATNACTTASFDTDGTYVLRLTADDGVNPPVSDTVSITVNPAASVAPATLVAHWSADADSNADGSWNDSVTTDAEGANDLPFTGTPGNRVSVTGKSWIHAFSFGGSDPVGAYEAPAYFQSLSNISVAVLFKADAVDANTVLFSTGGNGRGLSMVTDDTGALRVLAKDTATGSQDDSAVNLFGGSLTTGSWYQAVVTFDTVNDAAYLYLNGASVTNATATLADVTGNNHTGIGTFNTASGQLGGADGDGGGDATDDMSRYGSFAGEIADVRVFDGVLSSTEVSSLYASLGFTFADFAALYGLSGSRDADDDGDGSTDFLEYALNGNPTNPANKGLATAGNDGTTLIYVYAQRQNDPALVYTLRDTTNLVSPTWNTNLVNEGESAEINHFKTITNMYPMVSPELFIQLQVE